MILLWKLVFKLCSEESEGFYAIIGTREGSKDKVRKDFRSPAPIPPKQIYGYLFYNLGFYIRFHLEKWL